MDFPDNVALFLAGLVLLIAAGLVIDRAARAVVRRWRRRSDLLEPTPEMLVRSYRQS